MKKTNVLLAGAAIAGLLMAAGSATHARADDHAGTKGECWGVNSCKGTGDCAGKGHSCAGQNACKGKGYKKMTKAECDQAGGDFHKN